MKIAEIEVGKEYGVSEYRGGVVRRVEVLEIVTIAERTYSYYTGSGTRNRRHVRVKFLDEATRPGSYGGHIDRAQKDEEKTLAVKYFRAEWAGLSEGIRKAAERAEAERKLKREITVRLASIIRAKVDKDGLATRFWVGYRGDNVDLNSLSVKDVDTLLAYAEKGREVGL